MICVFAERNVKIQRFRDKRARRNFGKKVAYTCRKTVADSRVRVKGRFITKAEAERLKPPATSDLGEL